MARPKKLIDIKEKMQAYIKETDIPIVSEFAYLNNCARQYLYELPELTDTIKELITKKEAQLEKLALTGKINHTMAIFSLKQLGWKDVQDINANVSANAEVVIK